VKKVLFEAFALPNSDGYGPVGPIRSDQGHEGIEYIGPEWTGASVRRLGAELERAGDALRARPVAEIVDVLGKVGARFGTPGDSLRDRALECLPASAGYSVEMAHAVLDGMARDWTKERLLRLIQAEFERPAVLDGLVPVRGRDLVAFGPRLCTQIVSGSVPGVTVTALIRSLIVKGPTLIKPGLGDIVLPVLFASALAEEDRAIADALAVVYWPGGAVSWESEAVADSDVVVAYGSDAAVSGVRSLTAPTTRFVGYHHRISVAVIGRDSLTPEGMSAVAGDVADAASMFDQRGCVCPRVVFVEEGGATDPADFARAVATALAEAESRLPSGRLDDAEAASLQQFRGSAELRAATGEGQLYHGGETATWAATFEPDPWPEVGCLGRTVRISPLPIVPIREMSFPPPWWYHDGRGPLQDLVRWAEVDEG